MRNEFDCNLPDHYRLCKINNEIVKYDFCSANPDPEAYKNVASMIGKGTIYSVDGILQNTQTEYYFYVRLE